MPNQNDFTEKALFQYYLVSSKEENTVHSQIPFYLESNTVNRIKEYSEKINKLSLNILDNLFEKHERLISFIDDFPLKDKIFNLNCGISRLLWTRYDTFRDALGNIRFSEFNYDKPCAQKEISLYGSLDFDGNINKGFEEKLIKAIHGLCENNTKGKHIRIAVLIDPCHYEEFHVALYLKSICDSSDISVLPVGPKNLSVSENRVYAFEAEKVDIIIRLFPIEYLHEVSNIEAILECFNKGYVSIVTDPRVIAIQAKAFFAYLWELVDNDSPLLTSDEKNTVRECLPYTVILTEKCRNDVLEQKDKFVIKASLGRYSEEVYIGKLYTQDSWRQKVDEVLASKKLHILQDVIDIKRDYTYHVNDYGIHTPCLAYGNFGAFITGDTYEGLCVRWSNNMLTGGDCEWMSPVGLKDYSFKLLEYKKPDRKAKWDAVVEQAMFQYEFTGQYVNTTEYISLNSLLLENALYEEILDTCSKFCSILSKTSGIIQGNLGMFLPLLGIPKSLRNIIQNSCTDSLCVIGRIDLVIDNDGNIKILEFNSETPAGLVESIGIQDIIKKELDIPYCNPNQSLREDIIKSFRHILKDFESLGDIKNIAFLCTSYHEDLYNTKILYEACKDIGCYNVLFGNIYDLEARGDKLFLYDTPLDAIYRYFPLDWFAYEKELGDVLKVLNLETLSINPTHTMLTQSKAIYAVIYELLGRGFYTEEEELFINKHLPYTCLEPDNILSADCLAKPCLSREGSGIVMSYEGIDLDMENYVLQERVNTAPAEMVRYTTEGYQRKHQFPVIGVYITGSKPSGIFSRTGDFITNDKASFVATFVNNHKK